MLNELLIRDLRLFCQVVRKSSFVATAEEFGNSPTHVSKRIRLLEATLGVKLLHRTTRHVKISEDGETVYRWAQKILKDVDAMNDELSGSRLTPKGTLRISASPRLGREHIAPIVSLLERTYPDLAIWLELMDRRVRLIEEGFDLDIRIGEVQEPGLIPHHIARTPRILCASPEYLQRRGHPKKLQDLVHHDCLVFREREEPFGVWRLEGPEGWDTVKVTGSLASNHSDVAISWALDGHGIVLVSDWNVDRNLAEGTLVRVLPAWRQPADVWAVTAARLNQSAKLRICIDFLREQLNCGEFALKRSPSR